MIKRPLADILLQSQFTRSRPARFLRPGFVMGAALAASVMTSTVVFAQGGTQAEPDGFQAFREKMAQERQEQQQAVKSIASPLEAAPNAQPPAQMPVVPATAAPAIAAAPATTTTTTTTTIAPATAVPAINAIPAKPAENANIKTLDANIGASQSAESLLGPAANLPLNGNLNAGPQSQAEIQAALEAETMTQRKKQEDRMYDAAVRDLMPLRPDQVRDLLGKFTENREAAETPYSNPEPKQVVQTVSMDPSEAPPIIKTAPGNVTTLTILDSSGSPWPIQDVSWAGKFMVTPPESGGHVLRITPQSAHGVGNISIRLVDLISPITMTLKTGLDEVYYRFDARIPKAGPLAKAPLIEYGGLKSIAGKDNNISSLLDGTPPTGSTKLRVQGTDGRTQAWRISDKIYLRTPLTLLSPGWDSSASSADGMNVYTIPQAPVILLSDQGRMVQTRIADEEVK